MKKILLLDDSTLMRRVLSDIINQTNEYTVAYTAGNGIDGLQLLESNNDIAVCLCDINMPLMSGLELLQVVKRKDIQVPFVVISSSEDANDTITALELGAVEFIKKPERILGKTNALFERRLMSALDVAVAAKRQRGLKRGSEVNHTTESSLSKVSRSNGHGKLVALVCSTGGPRALQYVIPKLPKNLAAPMVIVQHMPAGFTNTLAMRLDGLSSIKVKEAEDTEKLENGVVYIAKGGMHLALQQKDRDTRIKFDDSDPVVGLKPCGNIMYKSLCGSNFDEIICVVLTGMGADGTKGIRELAKTNDIYVIAQDEASSTVYGMPKSIYESGLTNCVCDINDIANEIVKKVGVL